MNLKDLFATVSGLAKRLDESARAEFEAFKADVSAQVEKLKTDIASGIAEREKLAKDLSAAAEANTNINAAIKSACAALKVDAPENSSPAALLEAMQYHVSATIAKLSVPAAQIPGTASAKETVKTREEFNRMTPANQASFLRSGGKLTD